SLCDEFWSKTQSLKDQAPLDKFYIEPLFAREMRTLTVHVFNPRMLEEDIVTFLRRYVDVQGAGRKIIDVEGFWTGKRSYAVRLRPSPGTEGGLSHPLAFFSIGASRGYLYYHGQPLTCRNCGGHGHVQAECKEVACRRCGKLGHLAKDCNSALVCNLCGGTGHVFKDCTKRAKSFADIVKGKNLPDKDA
uniref:CCHC-type domain-containing protein n=1 Tax=Lepisosteus oculatus TaxID=7918 RepID=W5NL99_LEPOC